MRPNKVIALTGGIGSGKSTVGRILSEKLGAEVYSTGTIQRAIAAEMGMTTLELNKYSETHPEIDDKIDDGLRALNQKAADVIIDSRMAWHFVPDSFAVYMAADPAVSAARIMNAGRESEPFSNLEEAIRSIAARRQSEMQRYFQLYGVNIKDLENYDYVVDTSFVAPETVAEHILAHYQKFRRGEAFPRYELCAARLLPAAEAEEEGEPAAFEVNGNFYIARGAGSLARQMRSGARLVELVRAEVGAPGSAEQIAAWEARTGVRVAVRHG